MKETYETIGAILRLIQYEEYQWLICADLKVVAILMGLKQGYAKHQCFLCLWEGRKDELHYDYTHVWPPRNVIHVGTASQEKDPLVRDRSKTTNKQTNTQSHFHYFIGFGGKNL